MTCAAGRQLAVFAPALPSELLPTQGIPHLANLADACTWRPCTEPAVGFQQVCGRARRRGGRRRRQGRLRQRQCAVVRARRRRRRQQWLHVFRQWQRPQQGRQPQPPLSLINAELYGPEQSREHRGLWNSRGSRRQWRGHLPIAGPPLISDPAWEQLSADAS